MNNPFEMIVAIVAIVMIASIFKARYRFRHRDPGGAAGERNGAEAEALRNEVRTLKERIAVLESIATDSSHRLSEEIESLRGTAR